MHIPYIVVAIFVSLCIFYYFSQKSKIRREGLRERRREKTEEYLNALLHKKEKHEANNETSANVEQIENRQDPADNKS